MYLLIVFVFPTWICILVRFLFSLELNNSYLENRVSLQFSSLSIQHNQKQHNKQILLIYSILAFSYATNKIYQNVE